MGKEDSPIAEGYTPGRPLTVHVEAAGKSCAACRFANGDHCGLFNERLAVELVESMVQRGARGPAHYFYPLRSERCLKAEQKP